MLLLGHLILYLIFGNYRITEVCKINITLYRVIIKYCVFFPKNVVIFLSSAISSAALVFDLPLCTLADTEGNLRMARVRNTFQNLRKNTIFNEHPVYLKYTYFHVIFVYKGRFAPNMIEWTESDSGLTSMPKVRGNKCSEEWYHDKRTDNMICSSRFAPRK